MGRSSHALSEDHVNWHFVGEMILRIFYPKRRDHSGYSRKGHQRAQTHSAHAVCHGGLGEFGEDPYEVLGLQPHATFDEIKHAYQRLELVEKRPDVEKRLASVKRAYERLLAERCSEIEMGRKPRPPALPEHEEEDEDSVEDEERAEQAREARKVVQEQFKRFEAERLHFKRYSTLKATPRRKNPRVVFAGAGLPDEPFAEFAYSKHDVAVAISSRFPHVLWGLLSKAPLNVDLGRGSTPLHFAARFADEAAAAAVVRLAGHEWLGLLEVANDDSLTPADVGLKFHPEGRLTERLLQWQAQAEEARALFEHEERRVIEWQSVLCTLLVLGAAAALGGGTVVGGLCFAVVLCLNLDGKVGFFLPFTASLAMFHVLRILRESACATCGEVIWDCLWVAFNLLVDSRCTASTYDLIDFGAARKLRDSYVTQGLGLWMALRASSLCFPPIFSAWYWLVLGGTWLVAGRSLAVLVGLQGVTRGEWLGCLCTEQLMTAIVLGTYLSERWTSMCRLSAAVRGRAARGWRCVSSPWLALLAAVAEGACADGSAPRDIYAAQCQARLEAHRVRVREAEARQTRAGQQKLEERFHSIWSCDERDVQRMRQQEEAAQRAHQQRRQHDQQSRHGGWAEPCGPRLRAHSDPQVYARRGNAGDSLSPAGAGGATAAPGQEANCPPPAADGEQGQPQQQGGEEQHQQRGEELWQKGRAEEQALRDEEQRPRAEEARRGKQPRHAETTRKKLVHAAHTKAAVERKIAVGCEGMMGLSSPSKPAPPLMSRTLSTPQSMASLAPPTETPAPAAASPSWLLPQSSASRPAKAKVSGREDGVCPEPETCEVIAPYSCVSEGYLAVQPGMLLSVHFWQGQDEYEHGGWAYSKVLGDVSRAGWVPQRVLALRCGGGDDGASRPPRCGSKQQ